MYELKTKVTNDEVGIFLAKIEDPVKRQDCYTIAALMEKVTGKPAAMWGTAIVGFDKYHYKYASGHEGEMCRVGFSPRKANITLYVRIYDIKEDDIMKRLGKHKTGKGCLYINKLADVDLDVLEQIIVRSLELMRLDYPD